MRCNSCEATMINGIYCHESNCPNSWETEERKCRWCGQVFHPENKFQHFCEDSCSESYNS